MENVLNWVAPIATIIAALMTASNLGSRITGSGFIVFTVGSLAWLSLGIMRDDPPLLWMNAVLTAFNLFGIWRWLGRQAKFEDGGLKAAAASEREAGETLFPLSLTTKAAVSSRAGQDLGTCVDAMAGCTSGRISYLVVAEGGVAGIGERLRRLDWNQVHVDGDTVRTHLDPAGCQQLDQLRKDQWPGR